MTREGTVIMPSRDLLKEFGPQMTSWWTLFKRTRLFLVYRDHMFNDPASSMPNLIQTPALSYNDPKPLEPELAAIENHCRVVLIGGKHAAS